MLNWIWLGSIVIFSILEAATAGLVSIWFVCGAAAALLVSFFGGTFWLQLVLFLVVSAVALVATRPLVRKMVSNTIPTNLDRAIGATARVTEEINNAVSTGSVYVNGKTWTARSSTGEVIPTETLVTVEQMEGVKLFVSPTDTAVSTGR